MSTILEPLRAILDALPDTVRGEIVEGQLIVTPWPTFQHQIVVGRLLTQLSRADGGEFVAVSGPELRLGDDVLVPDVAVWHVQDLPAEDYPSIPPALVVEVLSPSTRAYDRHTKVGRYAALGVPHVWLVDPAARTIESFAGGAPPVTVGAGATAVLPPFRTLRPGLDALWP